MAHVLAKIVVLAIVIALAALLMFSVLAWGAIGIGVAIGWCRRRLTRTRGAR